jgi:hypothetical protein
LTHSLLDQRLGNYSGSLPRWVNEGIAGHLSDPVSPEQLDAVSQLIHRDGVLTLDELQAAFPDGPYRDAAYLQGRSMMAWLVLKHPGVLSRLLDELAAGRTFDDALQQVAGLTPEAWLAGWHRDIPAYIYWLTFLASPAAAHVSGRVFGAMGSRYTLWSEPTEIRQVSANFLVEPDVLYEELEATLCAGLALEDLPCPAPPLTPDWRERYGHILPQWDFVSR